MPSSLTPVRAAVAAGLGAGVLLTAGVGAAAAGVLPGAAQDTARTWLDTVGVQVPGADEHSAGHADQRGRSAEAGTDDTDETTPVDQEAAATEEAAPEQELPEASEHGQAVSGTARSTEAEGADKGAEISGLASEGRSTAGRSHAGSGDETTESVTTESETDETATEDGDAGASTGAGEAGKAQADDASDGRRSRGAERLP